MSADLIVRSTRVLTSSGLTAAAVYVAGERISRISAFDDCPPGVPVDEAGDLVVMAGLVDTHVHLNEPGRTQWEGFATGTAAAAAGGITTIVEMPLNSVPATTTVSALEVKQRAADGQLHVDIAFWGGVVPGNTGELRGLAARGVPGFKAFMVPSGVDEFEAVAESDLRLALPILKELDLPLLVHAESPAAIARSASALVSGDPRNHATWLASRPPAAELEAIQLLISLCREFGTRIHVVHLSAADALPVLRAARAEGLPISVETCPHYLTFAAESIPTGATPFKCAPPIREQANQDLLWRGVIAGDIDLIATDHSPCPPAMKCLEAGDFVRAWGGIGSLEVGLPATWTGASRRGLGLHDLSRLHTANPARLAGLYSRKGALAPGFDADLVVWDPDAESVVKASSLLQRHKITPYDGLGLRGIVHRTYLRGHLVHRRSAAAPLPTRGQILRPHTHERIHLSDRSSL
jgi:allantoinase